MGRARDLPVNGPTTRGEDAGDGGESSLGASGRVSVGADGRKVLVEPSSRPGAHKFLRGDTYTLGEVFAKESFANGLICDGNVWYEGLPDRTWKILDEKRLENEIYRFASQQYWRLDSGKIIDVAVNDRLVGSVVHGLKAKTAGSSLRKRFDGIPLKDGAYDLNSGETRPFELDQFVTWTLPFSSIDLASGKQPKRWLEFLHEGFKENDIKILQEFFGYCLTGDISLQKCLWIYGLPGCGKSKILELLMYLVGEHQSVMRSDESFKSSFEEDLINCRLVYFADYRPDPNSKAGLNFMLTVVGGDPIQIRRKFLSTLTVRIQAKLVYGSNNVATFPDTGAATLRRLLTLHRVMFKGKRDPRLMDKLVAELPGIMAWALEGLKRLYARGDFDDTLLDKKLMENSARSMNPVYCFVEDACYHKGTCLKVDLFQAWVKYARDRGHFQRFNLEMFMTAIHQTAAQVGIEVKSVGPEIRGISVMTAFLPSIDERYPQRGGSW